MATITAGDLEAEVQGGDQLTIGSLRHRGDELLVAPGDLPEAYRLHGTRAGITLLHPWANRVGADRFASAAGAEIVVAADDPAVSRDGNGLAIHGLAVEGTWTVEEVGGAACRAVASFAAVPAFPWAHELAVDVSVQEPSGLEVVVEVRATGDTPVPVAFGWHPYFVLPGSERATWRLTLPARRRLALDDQGIPDGNEVEETAEDEPLGGRTFDDGYRSAEDPASYAIADATRRITVTHVAGCPFAQVFAPADADVVSLEPMTAPTDALRSGRDLPLVEPGETFVSRFTVAVDAT